MKGADLMKESTYRVPARLSIVRCGLRGGPDLGNDHITDGVMALDQERKFCNLNAPPHC
jgi:hypothetical protein